MLPIYLVWGSFTANFPVSLIYKKENISYYKEMSKAIDDPTVISVPADFISEKAIRSAVASSSNDLCSKSWLN